MQNVDILQLLVGALVGGLATYIFAPLIEVQKIKIHDKREMKRKEKELAERLTQIASNLIPLRIQEKMEMRNLSMPDDYARTRVPAIKKAVDECLVLLNEMQGSPFFVTARLALLRQDLPSIEARFNLLLSIAISINESVSGRLQEANRELHRINGDADKQRLQDQVELDLFTVSLYDIERYVPQVIDTTRGDVDGKG